MHAGILLLSACQDLGTFDDQSCSNCDLWGGDNRKEAYQVGPVFRDSVEAVGILLTDQDFEENADGDSLTLTLRQSLSDEYDDKTEGQAFCPEVRFTEQARAQRACASTLVAPDLLLTARHCVTRHVGALDNDGKNLCPFLNVAFGYKLNSEGLVPSSIPKQDVYECEWVKVLNRDDGNQNVHSDLALIKLKGSVKDRKHTYPAYSLPAPRQERFYLGFPFGAPMKMSTGAIIESYYTQKYLQVNSIQKWSSEESIAREEKHHSSLLFIKGDIFPGDSGGPLFDEKGRIQGLIKGVSSKYFANDYDESIKEENLAYVRLKKEQQYYLYDEGQGCIRALDCEDDDVICNVHGTIQPLAPYRQQLESFGIKEKPGE